MNGRTITNMNLHWKFHRGDEPKSWYKGYDDTNWRVVTLPHDWSVEEPFSQEHSSGTGYLPGGVGWYRKTFTVPQEQTGKRVYITFDGIYNNSQVWCNSYYVGKRPFGYSRITYDITDFISYGEKNVLSVKVNHKDIADSRWFTGSGIYRDVTLTITDPVHIDQYGVFVTTPTVSNEKASVHIQVRVCNETTADQSIQIKNTLLDQNSKKIAQSENTKTLSPESNVELDQTMEVENPSLWSPDTPYLYSMLTEIFRDGEVIDSETTPIGIRWFHFDAQKGFSLNGEQMKLKGVCVHHDAGGLGAAVPEKVWRRRLETLKEMGCNAIRMSHNPPAANLLDLCDQMGFLVMDEAFDEWEGVKNKWAVGHNVYPPEHFGYYEDFPQWSEVDLKEMVLRDRNHPSIILWSIGNEVDYPNDPYCHPSFQSMTGNNDANKPAAERVYDPNKPNAERLAIVAKRLVKFVKECDTTRPVTAALAFPELSNLTGFADALDVVGYNYKEHLYEEDLQRFPNRVTYGSENSHSLENWLAVRDNDAISAQFIWTGIDYLGEAKGWPVRANQAGFIDLAGFPKPGYYYRQSLWSYEPMAFLSVMKKEDVDTVQNRGRWKGDPHWNWQNGDELAVFCFTNCEKAELFINEKSVGTKFVKESENLELIWELPFEEGTIKLVGIDKNGKVHTHELTTTSTPDRIVMKADSSELLGDGLDVAHIEINVTDEYGNLVYGADDEISLSIEGPGEIIGLENGDIQDLQPYRSKSRKVYHGKLLAFVRTKNEPGQIIVKAQSSNLKPTEITITTT